MVEFHKNLKNGNEKFLNYKYSSKFKLLYLNIYINDKGTFIPAFIYYSMNNWLALLMSVSVCFSTKRLFMNEVKRKVQAVIGIIWRAINNSAIVNQ